MTDAQTTLLKQFVKICQADPSVLHQPKMAFYKEYLESLGATIPPASKESEEPKESSKPSGQKQKFEEEESFHEEKMEMDEEDDLPPIELDQSGVIPADNDPELPMGEANKEASEAELEQANDYRNPAGKTFSNGDFKKAAELYTKAIELNPGSATHHLMLGRVYAAQRAFDRAIDELQTAKRLSGDAPFIQAELARTYAAEGRRHDAQELIASLIRTPSAGGARLGAQYPAYVYAALGDTDRAFEWLNRALTEREPNILWAAVDPRLDDIRRDPRFETIIRRIARGK